MNNILHSVTAKSNLTTNTNEIWSSQILISWDIIPNVQPKYEEAVDESTERLGSGRELSFMRNWWAVNGAFLGTARSIICSPRKISTVAIFYGWLPLLLPINILSTGCAWLKPLCCNPLQARLCFYGEPHYALWETRMELTFSPQPTTKSSHAMHIGLVLRT